MKTLRIFRSPIQDYEEIRIPIFILAQVFLFDNKQMIMNIDSWAEGLTKDVFEKWKSDYPFWKRGFEVFYSPVRMNPKIMILSLNPGGDVDDPIWQKDLNRFKHGDFSLPPEHRFVSENYTMARRMKKFFMDCENLLGESVTLPVLFFRSPEFKVWKKENKKKRKEMESFCFGKVREIIDVLKPKMFLILGFRTYRYLKEDLSMEVNNETENEGENEKPISYQSEWSGIPIFCIMHPSGAHIRDEDLGKNRRLFFNMVDSLK